MSCLSAHWLMISLKQFGARFKQDWLLSRTERSVVVSLQEIYLIVLFFRVDIDRIFG